MPQIHSITKRLAEKQILTPLGLSIRAETGSGYIRERGPSLERIELYGNQRSHGSIISTHQERDRR